MDEQRPRPTTGSPESCIQVVLGQTGLDYVLLSNEDDGDDQCQSEDWDTSNLDGLYGGLETNFKLSQKGSPRNCNVY